MTERQTPSSVPRKRLALAAGLALTAALGLAGCRVGPDYVEPDFESDGTIPAEFHAEVPDPALDVKDQDLDEWWTVFGDDKLNDLIRRASADNLDLRIAVARLNEAKARVGIAKGAWLPQVDGAGGVTRTENSENLIPGFGGSPFTNWNLGLEASWELDVFGRIARSVESARADLQASAEDERDVLVALYAEVARLYFAIRTLQAQLEAAERNIASQREILELTQTRFETGLSPRLDVAQAEQVLAGSESQVPPIRAELARAINVMALLLARPPAELHEELGVPGPIPTPPAGVAVGVPTDLLRQRPDIRAAERRLAAQTARIGVATADLYPQFSLLGSFGYAAREPNDLFETASRQFTLGPVFRWNLFDGNRIRSQIRVEEARTEQALLGYELTVRSALEEVESAIVAFAEEQLRVEAVERAAVAATQTLELATELYREGLTDFQDVLDAQRSLFGFEGDLAAAKGTAGANLVFLYKALGGGWDPDLVDGPPEEETAAADLPETPEEEAASESETDGANGD